MQPSNLLDLTMLCERSVKGTQVDTGAGKPPDRTQGSDTLLGDQRPLPSKLPPKQNGPRQNALPRVLSQCRHSINLCRIELLK